MRDVMITEPLVVHVTDLDDAVFQLQKLHESSLGLLVSIKEKQKEFIRIKFREGAVISTAVEKSNHGDNTIERLSQATGISTSALYDAKKLYEFPRFNKSLLELEGYFELWESENKSINWTMVKNKVLKASGDLSPSAQAAEIDRRAQKIEQKAIELEREAENLERTVNAFEGSEHVKEQALGVATKAVEVARERRDQAALMDIKPERITDYNYLKFIKEQPCLVTGQSPVDPHHFIVGGMGTKGSDYATVPLTRQMHDLVHRAGQEKFEETYMVNFKEEMARLMHLYFVGITPWQPRLVRAA